MEILNAIGPEHIVLIFTNILAYFLKSPLQKAK